MSDDLVPEAQQLSPRLQWLERHGLVVTQARSGTYYCRLDDENFATGETAEAACANFCDKTRLPHWTQENP